MTTDSHQEIIRFDIAMDEIFHVYVFDTTNHLKWKEKLELLSHIGTKADRNAKSTF